MTYPKYPTPIADLIDRMAICQLKAINIPMFKAQYDKEIEDIISDINYLITKKKVKFDGEMLRAVLVVALSNQCIWTNETKARQGGSEQDKLLKFTHSVNGMRNNSKNIISEKIGDRKDLKIDCLAAEFLTEQFLKEHGNWNIYQKELK